MKSICRWATLTLGITTLFTLYGCGDFVVADKSKEVVLSKAEYEQLKALAQEPNQVNRYQLHRDTGRTWRLDTATGRLCLMLTSEADWKKEGAQMRCLTDDGIAATERHNLYPATYDVQGRPIFHPFPESAK